MESVSSSLASQARNNINILSVSVMETDTGGEVLSACVCYEFQYRHRAGATPHWVKTCDVVNPSRFKSGDQLRAYVVEQVREARAELEG